MEDDDITSVLWTPGDKINVFFTAAGTVTGGMFTNKATSAADKASFSGSINIISGTFENPVSDQMFRAIYPYDKENTCDGSAITFSIPAKQSCPAGTFADGQWPTMARSNGLNLPFYAVCSGIKFKVLNANVTSVTFTNKDGGAINGTVTAGWDSNNLPHISSVTGGTAQTVVTPEGTDTFTAGSIYFAVLPTVTMSEGIEVTYKTATSHCTYVNGKSINFERNKFNKLYGKDAEYEEDPTPKYYKVTEAEEGQSYLIVSNGYALKNNNGSLGAEAVTDNGGVIMLTDATKLLWTAGKPNSTSSGYDGPTFSNGSKYLYRASGSSTLSLKDSGTDKYYDFNYTISDGSTYLKSNSYYICYDNGWKAQSNTKTKIPTILYSPVRPKQKQELSFDSPKVTWTIGDGFQVGGTYDVQSVKNAFTSVSYTSSVPSVASVSGTKITINGPGTTTITATASADDNYYEGCASYTLVIKKDGVWDLENESVFNYLNAAADKYNDTNWSSVSIVTDYCSNSSSNRKDVPAPVSLNWTSVQGTGDYTVNVYNDQAHSDLEMALTSSDTSADIYNLIPGRTYYYSVTRGSSEITTGTFSTTGRRRMLKVSDTYAIGHANNCRDFGGQKTTDGKTLKYGMIFRGTNMDATTDTEKDYLADYMNLGLDVDLRNGSASSTGGSNGNGSAYNPFNGTRGVSYVKGNFTGLISDFYTSNSNAKSSMTNIFTQILSTIKNGKSAYIHCYVGADRTGYTCMLLEAVLGVSPKDCSIDFELTSFSVVGKRQRNGGGNPIGLNSYNYINGYSKGSSFKEKAYNILIDYGVTPAQIEEFRAEMLE